VIYSGSPIFRFESGEVHLFNDRSEDKVKYPFDWHRSALATVTERKDNTKLSWFKRWLGSVLVVSPDPRRMSGIAAQEVRSPDQYLANFADWYRHLRQETDDFEYINDLREVISGFVAMRLEDAGERRREIKLKMADSANGTGETEDPEYLLGELSEGQRVLIGLYAVSTSPSSRKPLFASTSQTTSSRLERCCPGSRKCSTVPRRTNRRKHSSPRTTLSF
jgi:hypothetical protein